MTEDRRNKYDVVFWGHGHNEIERYLPIMVRLKQEGIKPLLFFQDYDFEDGLSDVQLKIIKEYGLNVLDYSPFIKNDVFLKFVNIFVRLFRDNIKTQFLYNKCRGLRSRIIGGKVNEKLVNRVVKQIDLKVGVFDTIGLVNYRKYPYGSYYIKKTMRNMGITDLCIHHGGTGHLFKVDGSVKDMDFYKIYVPNEYEGRYYKARRFNENTEVLPLGDPRFDRGWKMGIKHLFSEDIENEIKKMKIATEFKILYLSPNLEHIGKENEKYQNLYNVARLVKELGNTTLLIKPHPRYRGEKKIKEVMAKVNLSDFFIIENKPLVCYGDLIDFIISSTSSVLHDVLPEVYHKTVIYDDFSDSAGLENIFSKDFVYLKDYNALRKFFNIEMVKKNKVTRPVENGDVTDFCKKWVAGGRELDSIVDSIAGDILFEINKKV